MNIEATGVDFASIRVAKKIFLKQTL